MSLWVEMLSRLSVCCRKYLVDHVSVDRFDTIETYNAASAVVGIVFDVILLVDEEVHHVDG